MYECNWSSMMLSYSVVFRVNCSTFTGHRSTPENIGGTTVRLEDGTCSQSWLIIRILAYFRWVCSKLINQVTCMFKEFTQKENFRNYYNENRFDFTHKIFVKAVFPTIEFIKLRLGTKIKIISPLYVPIIGLSWTSRQTKLKPTQCNVMRYKI